MIKVENLTKTFAGQTAVNDVSFEVGRGEIVGFLGPNGAGKTTTMRMLTGYLAPSYGRIEIAGFNMRTESLEARRRIGYMPENCPLYPEMRVDEYLTFRAQLKGLRRKPLKKRRDAVKEQCGLTDVGQRIIGQLSKGYRQRVGLADSLLHEPDLLILDEPTAGLDPNQIREVRELIHRLAEKHTLLLSTHILPEAEMSCRRILIINNGRIAAADTPESLQKRLLGDVLVSADIAGDAEPVQTALRALPEVDEVRSEKLPDGWNRFHIDAAAPDIRTRIFEAAVTNGWTLRELHLEGRSLEELFVEITRNGGEAAE